MYTLIILISTMYMKDVKFQDFTSEKTCQVALKKVENEFKLSYCIPK